MGSISSHPGARYVQQALTRIATIVQNDNNPELLKELTQRHAGKLHHLNTVMEGAADGIFSDFICPKEAMDCTQPEDLGYGTPQHAADMIAWKASLSPKSKRSKLHPTRKYKRLSYARDLCADVMGKNYLYDKIRNPWGILPEFSKKGYRRCLYVGFNGFRCLNYAPALACRYHMTIIQHAPHLHDKFAQSIKNVSLREAYEAHLRDPAKRAIDSEIALMRTMLTVITTQLGDVDALKDISPQALMVTLKICEKITQCVERMANIEQKMQLRISADQVNALMSNMLQFMAETMKPTKDQFQALIDYVEKSPLLRTVSAENIHEASTYGEEKELELNKHPMRRNDQVKPDGTIVPERKTKEEFEAQQDSKAKFVTEKLTRSHADTPSQSEEVESDDSNE